MKTRSGLIACGILASVFGGFTLTGTGHAQQPTIKSDDAEISFNEPWVVFRPDLGPTREQVSIVPNENGKKTLEFSVLRKGDEILLSPSFPIRGFTKVSFKLWSKQKTMMMTIVEDRDGCGFHTPVPTPDNQWIDVTLTPSQFVVNDDARIKKTALDASILQSKILMLDAGKMLGLRDPNLIKIKDMHIVYDSATKKESVDTNAKPVANRVAISNSSVQEIRSRVKSLRPADLIWHHIPWKTSLTEAVKQARASHKPIFVWAFLHLPKDERC